jgi:hypothetical protein
LIFKSRKTKYCHNYCSLILNFNLTNLKYKANKPGNVYTYPTKKWYKHRRLEFDSNDLNYLFPRHHFQSMSQQLENGMNTGGSGSYYSNLNGNLLNENSNSMDSFHYNTIGSSHNGLQGQMLKQTSSNSNEDYGIGNSNDEWSHNHNHNQQQSSHHMIMHEDSFENFDAKIHDDDDSGGDPEDYDDPSFKKKKGKKTKTGRKKLSELGPDDKPFSCKGKRLFFYFI